MGALSKKTSGGADVSEAAGGGGLGGLLGGLLGGSSGKESSIDDLLGLAKKLF